jgi:hypothetical protein
VLVLVAAADALEDKGILVEVDDDDDDDDGVAEVVAAVGALLLSLVFVTALPVADRLRVFGPSKSTTFSSFTSTVELISVEDDGDDCDDEGEEDNGDDCLLLFLVTVD